MTNTTKYLSILAIGVSLAAIGLSINSYKSKDSLEQLCSKQGNTTLKEYSYASPIQQLQNGKAWYLANIRDCKLPTGEVTQRQVTDTIYCSNDINSGAYHQLIEKSEIKTFIPHKLDPMTQVTSDMGTTSYEARFQQCLEQIKEK